ncbi:MAG: glycosyltransferase family 2 protein [Clostridia bacterium]|nr:glycosyltransferase family 2 protein [Clostridia bacterium]
MTDVLLWVGYIVQILFLMLGAYYFGISLFSFIPRKNRPDVESGYHDFALIVAAHNESQVIGNMVESLRNLNYPKDKYSIFVIADNCTDNTAEIARGAGAEVYERFNDTQRGKGFALEWMFDKIYNMERKYDSVVIFDADNIVDKEFLVKINEQNNKGFKVVQGYIDSKNPDDSWVSYSYSLGFWSTNKLFQQSRYNLGLGCQLCGTGFSVTVDVLKELGWGATCLTEDMEFTMKLCLNDVRVAWANDAIVYDEKPITFMQSWKQRTRWMQGHADVFCRFFKKLIVKAVKERSIFPIDCALYLFQPIRIITMGAISIMGWLQTAFPDSNLVLNGYIPTPILMTFVIGQFFWLPFVMCVEKRISKRTVWGYLTYIIYSFTWCPIAIIGFIKRNEHEWYHTQHTRQIKISEINN